MRILMILLILLLYSTAYAGQGMYPVPMAYATSGGGPITTQCEGWSSVLVDGDCEFDEYPPNSASYSDDRTYLRMWTATYDGTALAVSVYNGGSTPTPNGLWAVVYKMTSDPDGELVCSGEYTGVFDNNVEMYMDLPAGCDFNTGDDLLFGFASDPTGNTSYRRDDDGGMGLYWNSDNLTSGPPQDTTFSIAADRDMAFILKTVTR